MSWIYPKDLINPVKTNTWYRLTLRVDDLNGFRIELRERDGGAASATYTYPMPAGKTWRFHQWTARNAVYLDNYVERADSVLSTVFIGNHFEQDLIAGNGVRKYYYLGGKRVATGNATGLYFIHGDQLGSASLTTSTMGTVVSQMLFNPTGASIKVGGWLVRASSNSGAVSTRVTISANVTLLPSQHYLVAHTGFSNTVKADQKYASEVPDDGGVAVVSGTLIIDQVGFSAGSAYPIRKAHR